MKKQAVLHSKTPFTENICLLLLQLILLIIPLLVYHKSIPLSQDESLAWTGETEASDFFYHYKTLWLLLLTGALTICFLIRKKNQLHSLKPSFIYYPVGVYILFVLLSTSLSKHPDVALNGFIYLSEGIWVLISYILLFVISFNIINTSDQTLKLLKFLLIAGGISGIIGFFQFFGYDFFESKPGQKLTIPSGIDFDFISSFGKHYVCGTLSNSNYVGSFMSLLCPVSLILFLSEEKRQQKIIYGILFYLFFFNLCASQSRAGMAGFGISLLVSFIVFRKLYIKNTIRIFILFIISTAMAFFINSYHKKQTKKELYTLDAHTGSGLSVYLKKFILKNDSLEIATNDFTLRFRAKNNELFITDEKDSVISYFVDNVNEVIMLKYEKFRDYKISIKSYQNLPVFEITKGKLLLDFAVKDNNIYFIDLRGRLVNRITSLAFPYPGKESKGSGRFYIWYNSLPLLRSTIFTGAGPDNFVFKFPQSDYGGKFNTFSSTNVVVEKPHSFYLQTFINTGGISLLALVVVFITYFIQTGKLYLSNLANTETQMAFMIFTAITGWLVTSIFNDSYIGVSPVFWILLGVGFSYNHKVLAKTHAKRS